MVSRLPVGMMMISHPSAQRRANHTIPHHIGRHRLDAVQIMMLANMEEVEIGLFVLHRWRVVQV